MSDEEKNRKKKKSIFNFYDSQKVGKGVKKAPPLELTFKNFFTLYGRHFRNISKINLLAVFGNFPFLFALYGLTGNLNVNSFGAASTLFAPLWGAMNFSQNNSPVTMALFGVHGVQSPISIMTTATYVIFALSLLIIFTWGPINVGCTYLLRNMLKNEPLFFMHDFFYAVKKNLRQGMIVGILDCGIYALLIYNIIISYFNMAVSGMVAIVFYANLLLILVYSIMRFYIYIMLVTFDLSIWKLLKNAFIFSVLGGKRNITAVIAILFAVMFNYAILIMFLPLGIILPFLITIGSCMFIAGYASYPKIKEIMIDPYYKESSDDKEYEEPIFIDRG